MGNSLMMSHWLVHISLCIIPITKLEPVLESIHDRMGHQGIEHTQNLLRQRWVGMYEDVDKDATANETLPSFTAP